ncbi:hypothetical protein C0J52_19194 [Blattella germanica]|nr:hypothetical protein C0J52_19194 [Blattella germanica]
MITFYKTGLSEEIEELPELPLQLANHRLGIPRITIDANCIDDIRIALEGASNGSKNRASANEQAA